MLVLLGVLLSEMLRNAGEVELSALLTGGQAGECAQAGRGGACATAVLNT